MAIFKCKMCGADLNVQDGMSVVECSYCGTTQTISATDDEKRVNLYNRANYLRMNSEFDKAAGLYEQIVAEFPNDAEAYWGLCLCNYGIEYVDDPATGAKIPTIHRASFEKMSQGENYKRVLEKADMTARLVYQEQAQEIDRIMGEVLAISQHEEPYDIFICYKETDEIGGRTLDSVIAQNIYDALTDKGYKVFFSRITLESKLGKQYEPYIFAALNSAKVMLAVGTDYDHFNAVWVKNEWRRFLKLAAADKSKEFFPCYKDMDPNDFPTEFRGLQAQDMGKVGAMQDLLRGIDKIFGRDKKTVTQEPVVNSWLDAEKRSSDMFLENGFRCLSQQMFDKAKTYFDSAVDRTPNRATAYWGQLLCKLHCMDAGQLTETATVERLLNHCQNGTTALEYNYNRLQEDLLFQLNPQYTDAVNRATPEEKKLFTDTFATLYQSVYALYSSRYTAESEAKQRKEQQLANLQMQKNALIQKKEDLVRQKEKAEKRQQKSDDNIHILPTIFMLLGGISMIVECIVDGSGLILSVILVVIIGALGFAVGWVCNLVIFIVWSIIRLIAKLTKKTRPEVMTPQQIQEQISAIDQDMAQLDQQMRSLSI